MKLIYALHIILTAILYIICTADIRIKMKDDMNKQLTVLKTELSRYHDRLDLNAKDIAAKDSLQIIEQKIINTNLYANNAMSGCGQIYDSIILYFIIVGFILIIIDLVVYHVDF